MPHLPDKLLHNNVVISGKITDLQISRNHSFGIIFLHLNKSHPILTGGFGKADAKLPYRILNDQAEIYTSIPHDLQKGDSVLVDSNKGTIIYFAQKGKEKTEGGIYTISERSNLDYITKYSKFK